MSWIREREPDGRGWESRWWAAQPWEAHAVPWDPHGSLREASADDREARRAATAYAERHEVRAAS